MKTKDIKKMLKARHSEILKNYSKIRILSKETYHNEIGYVQENCYSTKFEISYENVKYVCDEKPSGGYSAKFNYTISKLEDK